MTRLFKDRKWEELCRERRLFENSMSLLFVFCFFSEKLREMDPEF